MTAMTVIAASTFGDLDTWQAMLDRHAELFTEMTPGSAVGIVPRTGSGIQPGKHVAGLDDANAGEMLVWRIRDGHEAGMGASGRRFAGFRDAGVDLLFVADDDALAALRASLQGDTLSIMKRLIRKGNIMFYVMKTKYQLQDAGYEEFLDSLGLAFLGACR
jgi:hypothetical protein